MSGCDSPTRPAGQGSQPRARLRWSAALHAALLFLGACSPGKEREALPPPASAPATAPTTPVEAQGESELLLPESATWSCAEAASRLSDERAAVSAAVRLVRLAGATPLCVPDPLPPEVGRRLRVVRLDEGRWALGLSTGSGPCVASPVLIAADGSVTEPVQGADEEVALLCASEDAEVFPHLLFLPGKVCLLGEQIQPALLARSPPDLMFELRFENDAPYVALLWHAWAPATEGPEAAKRQPVEVARYRYDPHERAFLGPLSDKLPEPTGGLFELDLDQSQALVPTGGIIPEPPPVEAPDAEPGEEEGMPY